EAERRGEVKLSFAGNASSTVTNLTAKIKTAFTTGKNERTHNHMRKLLEEVSGYRIRTGRFAKGVGNDPVDDTAKVIRTPAAYDWDTIVPAASKLVAEKLKLNPSPEMTDYVTRWFVDGATTDNSTEAKDFQRAMRQADDYYRNKLYEVRELFDEWNRRTPEEIVRATIAHGKTEKPLTDKAKGYLFDGYEQFVEELYPIKQLVDAFEEELGRKLTDDENPYVLLRNYRGMAGRAKIMVEEGAAAIEALKLAFPNINFDNFKTIRMILESCDALNDEEKRKQFSDYLLACSVKDLHNLNNANLKAQTKLERTIERLEDAMDESKTISATQKIFAEIKLTRNFICARLIVLAINCTSKREPKSLFCHSNRFDVQSQTRRSDFMDDELRRENERLRGELEKLKRIVCSLTKTLTATDDAKIFLTGLPSMTTTNTKLQTKIDEAFYTLMNDSKVWYATEDLPHEIWCAIKGYGGLYEISNLGRVKSLWRKEPRILRPKIYRGYSNVVLSKGHADKRHN
ncbi:MAG: hypothetical protein IKP64_12805, partial [Selenomonadaceae bacterium]|nr:hypothetical protein [Selenomonadaceae bacterium]